MDRDRQSSYMFSRKEIIIWWMWWHSSLTMELHMRRCCIGEKRTIAILLPPSLKAEMRQVYGASDITLSSPLSAHARMIGIGVKNQSIDFPSSSIDRKTLSLAVSTTSAWSLLLFNRHWTNSGRNISPCPVSSCLKTSITGERSTRRILQTPPSTIVCISPLGI